MIYLDKAHVNDSEEYPGYRLENCINCKMTLGYHYGWQCPDPLSFGGWSIRNPANTTYEKNFSVLPPIKRFLTQTMKDSISQSTPANAQPHTVTINNPWAVGSAAYQRIMDEMVKQLEVAAGMYYGGAKPSEKTAAPVDISDWRAWRDDKPGFCPCNIAIQDCTYHKK